jgi:hypothetical protein
MRPIDRLLGFAPSYSVDLLEGKFVVTVTPPAIASAPPVAIVMTNDEFIRFQKWRAGRVMIQDAFPEWSKAQREKLQTGLGDIHFQRMTRG